jgi:hypothetical protein
VNSEIHEDMGTSELNQSQPIFRLFAPASAQAAAFGKPSEGALHDPATGRELGFARASSLLALSAATVAAFATAGVAHENNPQSSALGYDSRS